jgi:hypothetical protein
MTAVWGRDKLSWKGNSLVRQGSRIPLATIEPDGTFTSMWRVRRPDGRLTDMVNLSRAKDAAVVLALGALNNAGKKASGNARPFVSSDTPLSAAAE